MITRILMLLFVPHLLVAQINDKAGAVNGSDVTAVAIETFFKEHPDFKMYKEEVGNYYAKNGYKLIWYYNGAPRDYTYVLENEIKTLSEQGLKAKLPYKEQFDSLFGEAASSGKASEDLLITSSYFWYADKVFSGMAIDKSKHTGWYLPRRSPDLCSYLDTLIADNDIRRITVFKQYNYLKKALARYRAIEDRGGWPYIPAGPEFSELKPGDSSAVIALVRRRLHMEDYLPQDNQSLVYDEGLEQAILKYKLRQHKNPYTVITKEFIDELNISVSERIVAIAVNMERCRWIPPDIEESGEFVAVNIPSFRLHYFRSGKPYLTSKVIVGREATRTVVFSGEISYLAFSPYWNIPNSILQSEILPQLKKNPGYLSSHNMEWASAGRLRQKPGPANPLGLVKFMFPNANNIYLHDTPSKKLFSEDHRAFSHGCIRVEKAHDLAIAIMANDAGWPEEKTRAAMASGTESLYILKKKIPVYIGYFTAWADADGTVAFFDDIYDRDSNLAKLLYDESL